MPNISGRDLMPLVAWLRKEAQASARAAEGAADPYGQQLSLQAAEKLERASEIVKQFADMSRSPRPEQGPHWRTAND